MISMVQETEWRVPPRVEAERVGGLQSAVDEGGGRVSLWLTNGTPHLGHVIVE